MAAVGRDKRPVYKEGGPRTLWLLREGESFFLGEDEGELEAEQSWKQREIFSEKKETTLSARVN